MGAALNSVTMVMEDNALASGGISYGAAVSVGHWVSQVNLLVSGKR